MLRFRPILMTTMAALFGAVPLAFGTGTGSELRRPLGIAIIGGLIVSQTAHALHHAGGLSLHGPLQPAGGRGGGTGDPRVPALSPEFSPYEHARTIRPWPACYWLAARRAAPWGRPIAALGAVTAAPIRKPKTGRWPSRNPMTLHSRQLVGAVQ